MSLHNDHKAVFIRVSDAYFGFVLQSLMIGKKNKKQKKPGLSQPGRKQKTFVIVERFFPAVVTFNLVPRFLSYLVPGARERGGAE